MGQFGPSHLVARRNEMRAVEAALQMPFAEAIAVLSVEDRRYLEVWYGLGCEPGNNSEASAAAYGKSCGDGMAWRRKLLWDAVLAVGSQRVGPLCEHCAAGAPFFNRNDPPVGAVNIQPCGAQPSRFHLLKEG